ncbi:MAG TPA: hypothetical protein VK212_06315 [Lentimicrobium sp.]|nr:hypothetical protein [Lentimicrobium sp.]
MKTIIFSLMLAVISQFGFSQNSTYYSSLCDLLPGYSNCKTADDFRNLGDKFAGIASSDTTGWLADYYYAHCYIVSSFLEPSVTKDKVLDKIEKPVSRITHLVPDEAEVWALLGMYYTARLLVNPEERGYTFIGLSNMALEKAQSLDPQNPRVKLLMLKNEMGTTQYFGGPVQQFCKKAQALLSEWDNYVIKSPVHPKWGKTQVAKIVSECNL